ncbi:hypothetical protein Tco_0312439 [Tanacetum coccineum]
MYGFKECSSCGYLYNREHCCSNVSFIDNFVHDPNPISYDKTSDSSQQHPRNCSKCGGPFGSLYYRQCTCERYRRNYTDEVCALCCYEVEKSFVNDSNSVTDSPNIFYPPLQPQTSSLDQWHCFQCKDPLERGERCKRCSCKWCGSGLSEGFCFICTSNNKNSSIGDPNPNSFNDSQNLFDYPPQPQYQTYSCELCGNDAHYGYDCPPQVPFVYNQDPCFNQNFDNNFPQTSPTFPQQYLCCKNCGGPHETFQCQPLNQNFYEPNLCYNSNFSSFDQYQPPQYTVIHHPPQETSVEIVQARENLMKSTQTFLKKFNRISFRETPKVLLLASEKFFEIQHAFREKQHQPEDIQELLHKLLKDLQIIREELAEYINSPSWNCPAFYDNDDKYTIQYKEYLENSTNAITPDLPTEEPDNSLSIGDEHLNTNPEIESDEVIKSSVVDLVPILSKSEGISDDTCDVPFCDNSPPFDVLNDLFEIDPDQGKLTSVVMEDSLGEPRVHVPNVLPTHPTLMLDSDFIPSDDSLGSDLEVSFPSGTRNKIFDPGIFFEVQSKRFLSRNTFSISFIHNPLCPVIETFLPFSSKNEDKVFNPGILSSNLLSHRGKITSDFSEIPMMIYGGDILILDVPYLHFYPP